MKGQQGRQTVATSKELNKYLSISPKRKSKRSKKPRVNNMGISSNKSIPLLVIMETFRLRVSRMTKKSIHRRNLLINKKIQ
jgi:hypothetical protein